MANGRYDITLRQLTGGLDRIGNAFDRLTTHVQPAANQVSRISGSFQNFNKALKEIQTYGEQLTKTLDSIAPKGGKGKVNFDDTVFSAFSRLIDVISDSIDDTKLSKLQTVSTSMKTFTNSLKDMIAINKGQFDEINGFVKQMNTPLTKGKKDSPLNNIMSLLDIFTTTLGDLGARSQETSTGEDGKEHIKNIMNPRIQGIQDIFNTIKSFTARMTELNGAPIEEAITSLDNAEGHIHSFILKLGNFMRGEKDVPDGNGGTKTIEILDSHVQGTRDVIKTIDNLVSALNDMGQQTIHKGIDEVESANTSLCNFIEDLGKLGQRTKSGGVKRDSKGRFTSVSEVKEYLSDKVQGARDVVKTIELLAGDLEKMAEAGKVGLDNVDRAGDSLRDFINKLSEVGARDTHSGNGDGGLINKIKGFFSGGSGEVETFLNVKVQSVRDIINTLGILSSNLTKLATDEVKKGTTALDLANTSLYNFVDQLGSLGERTQGKLVPKPTGDGKTFTLEFEREINAKVEGIQDVLRVVGNLSSRLEQMAGQTIPTGIKNIDEASTNLQLFMVRLGGFGRTKETKKPEVEGGEPEVVEHLNSQVQSVRDVLKSIDILATNLQSMADGKIKEGLAYVDKAEKQLTAFIDKLGGFGRETVQRKDSEGKDKPVEVLNEQIQSVRDVLRSIDILSAGLVDLAGDKIQTGIENIGKAREALYLFIDELGGFTHNKKKIKDSDSLFGGKKTIEVLDGHIQSVRDILKSIELLSTSLTNLGGDKIENGLRAIDTARDKLYNFIHKLSTIGMRPDGSSDSGGSSDVKQELNAKVVAVRDILSTVNTLAGSLERISKIDTKSLSVFSVNIRSILPLITEFINQMAALAKLPAFDDFERVANALGKVGGALKDNLRNLEHSTRAWTKFKSIMRQIYTAFVGGAVVYSIVRGIKSAIKEMYNLEYAMARVNTIARVSDSTLKEMTHRVQDLSASFGVESAKVSKALYDINSATIKGAASMKILEQSMKLAVAGFTDVEKVSDLIAKAVNAYQYNVAEAAKISDILFVTVERGINPMEELSEYFGRLFTVSANAGVSLEETAAGLATLTARGYQTNVASTALNSAILKLSTGTKELNKLFQKYGYASSASALRTMGLAGALKILNEATGGATEKLHDLGFNYRDIRAATTLASGAISEYNKTLAMMNDKEYTANKTAEALAKVQGTVKYKFDQLKATFTVFIQTISEYVNKNATIKKVLGFLTDAINNVIDSMRGMNLSFKNQLLANLTTLIPKIVATYGVAKLFTPLIDKLAGGFGLVTNAIKGSTVALTSFGKLLLIFASIQGIAQAFSDYETIKEAGTWNHPVQNRTFMNDLQEMGAQFIGSLGRIADFFTGNTTDFGLRAYNALRPDDYAYQDWDAINKTKNYQGDFAQSQFGTYASKNIISKLKNFDIFANDLSEDKITEKYNELSERLAVYAKKMKVSDEVLSYAQKQLDDWRDNLYKQNSEMLKLLPNTQAFADVFSESSKAISDATEKYAGAMEKSITKILDVEESLSILSKKTGLSIEQIKSGVSSEENLKVLQELIEAPMKVLSENTGELIEPAIRLQEKREAKLKEKVASALQRAENFDKEGSINNIYAQVKKFTGEYPKTFGAVVDAMVKFPELADSIKTYESKIGSFGIGTSFDKYAKYENMNEVEKLKSPIDFMIESISQSGLIDENAIKKLDESRTEIAEKWVMLPKELKYSSEAISNIIIGTISDPEIRKALKYLSDNYIEVIKNSNDFRKSLSKLGDEMRKLDSQKIKVEDIVGNIFGLTSVSELKESLASALYDPAKMGILGYQSIQAGVNKYATVVGKGIMSKLSLDEILDNFVKATEGDIAFEGISPEDIRRKGKVLFDRVKAMAEFTSDFANQLSKTDFTKFMNRLQFGSEMSAWKQYKTIDSARIEEIMNSEVTGFGKFREAMKKAKEVGFENARALFKDEGWSDFSSLFKELNSVWQGSPSALITGYKNVRKQAYAFLRSYEDAFLTPMQRFDKVQTKLNKQLKKLKEQQSKGTIDPDLAAKTLDTIKEYQKLNEEAMNLKVPAAITASEAVKTGSKEAFDLVATNVFREIYKVNQQQLDKQKKLVNDTEAIRDAVIKDSKKISNLMVIR